MPKLTISTGAALMELAFSPGSSVREILEAAGVWVRTGCRGDGACGLCLVQLEAGGAAPPTRNERLLLGPDQLAQNFRLACQLLPETDLQLRIVNTVSNLHWRDLEADSLPCIAPSLPPLAGARGEAGCGLAIDLGTTQISYSLWNLREGRRLYARVGPNPQSCYGGDIVSRLMAAGESPENAQRLARLPLEALADDLREVFARYGFQPDKVVQAAIVGNTAMLTLLTGAESRPLLQPSNWTRPVGCVAAPSGLWASVLGIDPRAWIEVLAPLAGFVGSDLLAGVVATRLTEQPGSLLIDFGTNSEMALWDGYSLWVTSAAGGPAFESCGIQCGMPAEPGAIYRFSKPQGSNGLCFQVLGGGEAKGFCGSGLVDLIACLRDSGELTPTGNFADPKHRSGYVLQTSPAMRLTKADIDAFQRAKAAVGAGISTLLSRAQLSAKQLRRVCVCGVFGQNLDIGNAQRIGLLPDSPPERVELCGNTALAGCERLLFSPARTEELMSLRRRASMINLSQASAFDALFLENLYLQPLQVERA